MKITNILPILTLKLFLFMLVLDDLRRLMESAKRFNLVESLSVETNSIEVSHVQFVDDIIFFSPNDKKKLVNLMKEIELLYLKVVS